MKTIELHNGIKLPILTEPPAGLGQITDEIRPGSEFGMQFLRRAACDAMRNNRPAKIVRMKTGLALFSQFTMVEDIRREEVRTRKGGLRRED